MPDSRADEDCLNDDEALVAATIDATDTFMVVRGQWEGRGRVVGGSWEGSGRVVGGQ